MMRFFKSQSSRGTSSGFTLLEMSIVVGIIAIVGIAAVDTLLTSLQSRQLNDTQTRMAALQTALMNYRLAFDRLPCPANATYDTSSQYFGVEAANPGSCKDGAPAANYVNLDGTPRDPRAGMVPTKALRLPDAYAFDGWGRKIMYAVDEDMTQNYAFSLITANDLSVRMIINDAAGAEKTVLAGYVLISFGPNGHGAFPRLGSTRISYASKNTDEKQNCDCDSNAGPTGLNGIFVQKLPTQNPSDKLDSFDDVVVYATRSDMRSASE